jgi:hypothetical protein
VTEQVQFEIFLEPFTLDDDPALPSWTGTMPPPAGYRGASHYAANQVLYLEDYLPAGVTLPNPAYITGFIAFDEAHTVASYGANTYGCVSFAVDPARRYMSTSRFPQQQLALPDTLKTLGVLRIAAGSAAISIDKQFSPPIAYRPGDAIIVGPQGFGPLGGGLYEMLRLSLGFRILAEQDLIARPTSGPVSVFQAPLNTNSAGNNNLCIRNVFPRLILGGNQIRVKIAALSSPCVVQRISVGIRNGLSPDTIAAPVELLCAGGHGVSVAANSEQWSDWGSLTTQPGQSVLGNVSLFNGTGANAWAFRTMSGADSYSSNVDAWNTAAMGGTPVLQRGRTHVISDVQVQ